MSSATKRSLDMKGNPGRFEVRNEAGASLDHNRITRNLNWLFWSFLKHTKCESFTSDLPVFSEAKDGVYYPDLVVACSPEFTDCKIKRIDEIADEVVERSVKALTTPTLIAEVWSNSNTPRDRGIKLAHYEQIESLVEYLTVEQKALEVLRYVKDDGGKWKDPESFDGKGGVVTVKSFGLTLSLQDVYAKCEICPP